VWKLVSKVLFVLCCVGCSNLPFQKVSYVTLEEVNPAVMREQFALSLPQQFQLVNTILFQYNRYSTSAIGYTSVDNYKKAFTVVCLNPLGIKLFELSEVGGNLVHKFALGEFAQHGNFAQVVADDIKRIYFNRVPVATAEVNKKKYKIIFKQPTGSGMIKFVFAGKDNVLIEKCYYEGRRKVWSVFYYEYQFKKGKLYPLGIILKNYQFGYQLEVVLKEIK